MNIVAKPIQVVSWTDEKGIIHPVRFKLMLEDERYTVISIDRVIHKDREKLAGNHMMIFTCQSVIDKTQKIFEIKYELSTCKWILWKI